MAINPDDSTDSSDNTDAGIQAPAAGGMASYLVAADNHNLASGDMSWGDYVKAGIGAAGGAATGFFAGQAAIPIPVVGGVIGAVVGGVIGAKTATSNGKYLAAAAVSGGLSFYNTGVELNNWMGGDWTKTNPDDAMAGIDSDLAQYYSQNRQSADIAGFTVGSLIPMLGAEKIFGFGVAALRAAQAGKIGANFSEATGLLIPAQTRYLDAAVKELSGSSVFSLNNANVLKGFALGAGDEVVNGMIQTTAVMASMHASPILEDEDASDMAWNILAGGLFQGVVGGVFSAAKSYGYIRRGVTAAEQEAKPYMFVGELSESASPVHKILNWIDEKMNIPEVDPTAPNAQFQLGKQQETFRLLDDRVRGEFQKLAGGDSALAVGTSDIVVTIPTSQEAASRLLGLGDMGRINNLTEGEKQLFAARKRIDNGSANEGDFQTLQNTNIRYLQLHGENAGSLTDTPPVTPTLADSLRPNQEITVKTGTVQVGDKKYNFNTTPKQGWDPVGKDSDEIMARQIWAQDPRGAKLPAGTVVHSTDIPLIDKAVRENIPIAIKAPDGSVGGVLNKEQLANAQWEAKNSAAMRFRAASLDNERVSDPVVVEQKLKQMLGVPFQYGNNDGAMAWTYRGDSKAYKDIFLSKSAVESGNYSLARLAQAIKHEEGHNIWNIVTDILPGISQHSVSDPNMLAEMIKISQKTRPELWKQANKNVQMREYLNQPTELAADTFSYFSFNPNRIGKEAPNFAKLLGNYVRPVPQDMIDALRIKAQQLSNPEIAQLINVRTGFMEGSRINTVNPAHDMDAMYGAAKEQTDRMTALGRWNKPGELVPTWTQPSIAKMVIDTTPVQDLNGNVLEGMAVVKQQQRLNQTTAQNATASVIGADLFAQLPKPTERSTSQATRFGPGTTAIKSANDAYGSQGSIFQQIGRMTHNIIKSFTDESTSTLNSALYELKTNQAAATEWAALMTKLRGTPETYYWDSANQALALRRIITNEERAAQGLKPQLAKVEDPNAEESIAINEPAVGRMFDAHVQRNSSRVSDKNMLVAANGVQSKLDPRAVYAPPVNPKKYPYFAFVVDPTVNELGHVHMIYGRSEQELDQLISDVRSKTNFDVTAKNTELKTLTKGEVERFHKSMGDFSRDDTLSENYIRSELTRKGVSSNFIPATDPTKVADELLQWHLERDRDLARYAVSTNYSKEFAELKTQGESYTNLATSRVGNSSMSKWAENQVSNPYADYVKTALDITNLNEMPRWTAVNNYLDSSISRIWDTVSSMWKGSKSSADLEAINKEFERVGIKTAYYDAATYAHANHVASEGAFTKFISRANGVMATLLLRMDPLNAFNNTVGSTILTGSELSNVLRNIKAGNTAAVGELAKLANITVPGTGESILSPSKLYASSIARFFSNPEARQWAFNNGFTTRHVMEVDSILKDAAMTGKETDIELMGKADQLYQKFMKFGDIAEKVTGNKLAEQFNRFVSADIMRQITDVAVNAGAMSKENALAYVNTFVNRTQGNYLASQRPLMFQGPVGNAIGLFQTYQFNMAQQLLRHVAEGDVKDAALAMGLQTAVYGMNGLPGFQQINAHIVGTASGNTNHRDLYDATYGTAGKSAADWLMYGTASNLLGLLHPDLKMNLYTRGDINPRQPTIIPTQLDQVPIVGGFAKLFTSIKASMGEVANGGNGWQAFLGAIEHSGINRPLAGLAQTLEALGNPKMQSYSTSTKGNVIVSNDLMSLTNLTRIAGGKPLDEAIAVDAGYRLDAYKSMDTAKREQLGEAIKTTVLGGNQPTTDQVNDFAAKYARYGGKQEGFNSFFINTMKHANQSQVNAISENLRSPYAQSMQRILGGYELKDFQTQ